MSEDTNNNTPVESFEMFCFKDKPQQLRLNESQRALLIDAGIDVEAIGENKPIVLKFT